MPGLAFLLGNNIETRISFAAGQSVLHGAWHSEVVLTTSDSRVKKDVLMAILNTFLFTMLNFGQHFSKVFNLCGRRRRGGDPLAAVPSPTAQRAPAAAATAAQIEHFYEKSKNSGIE